MKATHMNKWRTNKKKKWTILLFFLVTLTFFHRQNKRSTVTDSRSARCVDNDDIAVPSSSLQRQQHSSTTNQQYTVEWKPEHVFLTEANVSIRSWGCGLTVTPFIFVHIGKVGGGRIRMRLAASAFNYTRGTHWGDPTRDHSFYPLGIQRRAIFCNVGHHNFLPVHQRLPEGIQRCQARTPIGQAMACPAHYRSPKCASWPFIHNSLNNDTRHIGVPGNESFANIVYTGHNWFGTEIHWLPAPVLEQWWRTFWHDNRTRENYDDISAQWKRLDGIHNWCGDMKRPMSDKIGMGPKVYECGAQHIQASVDAATQQQIMDHFLPSDTPQHRGQAWSAMYSSLPVLRVVMMREPFSWLTSLFAWHGLYQEFGVICDHVENATYGSGSFYEETEPGHYQKIANHAPGWARRYALHSIYQLCGSDCVVRHWKQEALLEELVAQAASNLDHGFAVVGILEHGQEEFFQMLDARVGYLKTSSAETRAQTPSGGEHSTRSQGEEGRCKFKFQEAKFQEALVQASPEIAALVHLYQVAVQVNRFQKEELSRCRPAVEKAERTFAS